jgi:CRISPR-associated protein Csb2
MTSRALLIDVRLLDGRYHGVRDWPPAPFRLFQALVAGAYGGQWRSEPDEEKDAAFRWLESLDPPHIVAPRKTDARTIVHFVPNNDLDAVGGDPRRVSEIRAGKTVSPILFDADESFQYAWRYDDGEHHAQILRGLAERLHTLGRGIDAAFAQARVCDWSEAELFLSSQGRVVAKPAHTGDPQRDPLCPMRGSLDSLRRRHAATARKLTEQREDRAMITLFRQPPKAQALAVAYDRSPVRLLFELRSSTDSERFRSLPLEKAGIVAAAVRDMVSARLTDALPGRASEIEKIIVGRTATSADTLRRVRFTPLPSIGHAYTDTSIRRVFVEIPHDCPIGKNDIAWAMSGQGLPGFDDLDHVTGEITETLLVEADDQTMLLYYGIGGRASRRWRSITPAALPGPRGKGRLTGLERAQGEQHAIASVVAALRHAGLAWRGADIRVQREPFHRKGVRADAFKLDPAFRLERFAGRLLHVDVTFPERVRGPLTIGDGRFLGLGLMAPERDTPPDIHVFKIDPREAPTLSTRDTLVRALRRAVMARADERFRAEGAGRNDPLPTFFSGHVPDGAPSRPGGHEHVFFLADDSDGDGKIDTLAVVAPHRADRTVVPMAIHLGLLDRALRGLSVLRAGSAGAPALAVAPEPGDQDPIFGRSYTWTSRTGYRPTRHSRAGKAEEAVAADLLTECVRRGLPRPTVEILGVTTGPRGGQLVRARLRFDVTVQGPLLLGRESHFGAGVFGIER